MSKNRKTKIPSLLDNEARGGDIAEGGFSFQDGVILAKIPDWLSYDSFSMVIREALCDAEAAFFEPGLGLRRDGIEAKNHQVTPSEFWGEFDRFRQLDDGHPGMFQWFSLVSAGLSNEIKPLANGLRRARDPYQFYEAKSSVNEQSFADFKAIAERLGRTADDASFLFNRVLLEHDWSLATDHASALFKHALVTTFPEFNEYAGSCQDRAHQELFGLLKASKNKPISRSAIEAAIGETRPASAARLSPTLHIHTAIPAGPIAEKAVCFHWEEFFGGQGRHYPPTAQWCRVIEELKQLHDWVNEYQRPRRVRISGDRRLSVSLAVGSVLSAVAGFTLEVNFRGQVWATDDYPATDTPEYALAASFSEGNGDQLVVAVGIIREVATSVRQCANAIGLGGFPHVDIQGSDPIVSAAQTNRIADQVKSRISLAVEKSGARCVHLFFAGPSPLAFFLGHRLNATVPVQCYEWLRGNDYIPTTRLLSDA